LLSVQPRSPNRPQQGFFDAKNRVLTSKNTFKITQYIQKKAKKWAKKAKKGLFLPLLQRFGVYEKYVS
jgi:hypothetical protein